MEVVPFRLGEDAIGGVSQLLGEREHRVAERVGHDEGIGDPPWRLTAGNERLQEPVEAVLGGTATSPHVGLEIQPRGRW